MIRLTKVAWWCCIASACRVDPGAPLYPEYPPWVDVNDPFLPGPFPYVPGEDRLSIGAFYEGEASEAVPIDDVTVHYYIFESTYNQQVSEDRVEGLQSDVLVVSGAQPWWGGGIIWDTSRDLSAWTTMHVSFLATDVLFEDMAIAVVGGGVEGRVAPSDYGFLADGAWHSLVIPLTAFPGVQLGTVTTPASFVADFGTEDSELAIDDLYFTKE